MPAQLTNFFGELAFDKLRFSRPSKVIFFCGGALSDDPKGAGTLRHYLLRDRAIEPRLKGRVVLAEAANKLYRDTSYSDLITFEEDIARVAGLILLVAESAGSLAELGAFAAVDTIRANLAVLIQNSHYEQESFVRFGPIQKLLAENDERVGVYPWKVSKSGTVVKSSIRSHVRRITKFINDLIARVPAQETLKANPDLKSFVVILWVLHLSTAVSITSLGDLLSTILPINQKELRNKLFCMSLVGWVGTYTYENKTYWYSKSLNDPLSKYSFQTGVADPARGKAEVARAISDELKTPRHVTKHVASLKSSVL